MNTIKVNLMLIDRYGNGNVVIEGLAHAFVLHSETIENIIEKAENKVDMRCRNTNIGYAEVNVDTHEFTVTIYDEFKK